MDLNEDDRTVRSCLTAIFGNEDGLENFGLKSCSSIEEEFKVIKKAYFKNVLRSHPDKGGDTSVFRDVQASFEVLRDLFDNRKVDSFHDGLENSADKFTEMWKDYTTSDTPSWDYFASAAEEAVPGYRVERAKSSRGTCKAKGKGKECSTEEENIEKGELRCGWLDQNSGAYGGWTHLDCWRVPSRIWLGIPDPETCDDDAKIISALVHMNHVTFCGLSELNAHEVSAVMSHIKNKENWAKLSKPKKKKVKQSPDYVASIPNLEMSNKDIVVSAVISSDLVPRSTAVVPTRERFVEPFPGKNGAIAGALKGKTVVLTGVFPEIGGGAGLSLGKAKVKAMIERFGGKCTSAISGRTNILIVGKSPGMSKVSKARSRGPTCKLMGICDLKSLCMGTELEDISRLPTISNFSSGYGGNSIEYHSSAAQIAYAAETAPIQIKENTEPEAKRKSVPKKNKKKVPVSKKRPNAKATKPTNSKKPKDIEVEVVKSDTVAVTATKRSTRSKRKNYCED